MTRRQIKVYADTSVFGGVFDPEFALPSRQFFEAVDAGRCDLVISTIVVAELLPAPVDVRNLLGQYAEKAQIAEVSERAQTLQSFYIRQRVVGKRASADALHVAIATVTNCNFVVSWNFKDLVNQRSITRFNEVNVINSFGQIGICSPHEVVKYVTT